MSTLDPLTESMLGLIELLELRRRRSRESVGLNGFKPDCLAKRLSTSVSDITPVSRPDNLVPGRAAADTAGKEVENDGDAGVELLEYDRFACVREGVASGVAGVEGEGEGDSTTHIRWDFVATSRATVWARVDCGETWKTGKESLPSIVPRSVSITEIKWMHVPCSRGRLLVLVRSFTSVVEMLPTTFIALSITAILVSPSSLIRVRASVRGLSPLFKISVQQEASRDSVHT